MIQGDLSTPFILFRMSGTTGPARYIAHSRHNDTVRYETRNKIPRSSL